MHFCAVLTVICQPIPVNGGGAAPPLNPPLLCTVVVLDIVLLLYLKDFRDYRPKLRLSFLVLVILDSSSVSSSSVWCGRALVINLPCYGALRWKLSVLLILLQLVWGFHMYPWAVVSAVLCLLFCFTYFNFFLMYTILNCLSSCINYGCHISCWNVLLYWMRHALGFTRAKIATLLLFHIDGGPKSNHQVFFLTSAISFQNDFSVLGWYIGTARHRCPKLPEAK